MKSIRNIGLFAALAAAAALPAGCETEGGKGAENTPVAIRITSAIDDMSRAAGTSWAAGDRIGITATRSDGTPLCTNAPYVTANGDGIFSPDGENFYFRDKEQVTFTAYYPYLTDSYIRDGVIDLTLSDECQIPETQSGYDLLFAQATGDYANPNVQFRFRHCLSRIVLRFLPGEGIASLSDIDYTLEGLRVSGWFNIATGAVAVYPDIAPIPLTLSVPGEGADELLSPLLFFPQEQGREELVLSLTMRGTTYYAPFQLPQDPDNNDERKLAAGYSYTYDVRVNQTDITVSPAAISPWLPGSSENVDSITNPN